LFVVDAIETAKSCTCSDYNKDIATSAQKLTADDDGHVDQWLLDLECSDDGLQPDGLHGRHSPVADVCSCVGSSYDDGLSTSFVSYQRPTAASTETIIGESVPESVPTLTGVQVCGPASFELLFMIQQLASTACFVDDAAAFLTMLQTASIDSSPRIIELHTDKDEADSVAGNFTSGAGDSCRQDRNERIDETATTAYEAVEEHVKTGTATVQSPDERLEKISQYPAQVNHRRHEGREQQAIYDKEVSSSEDHVLNSLPVVPQVLHKLYVDNKLTTKRSDPRLCLASPLAARKSTVSKYQCAEETALTLRTGPATDVGLSRQQRQNTQQHQPPPPLANARAQRDRVRLLDVFEPRRPPLPMVVAKRPEPAAGRRLRLPPVDVPHRAPREAPLVFPAPPQRRRSHPLARRRTMTPPNRNVLAARAVWPSMASGRAVEDEWTRRAAVMRRRVVRLPPIKQTVSVASWK